MKKLSLLIVFVMLLVAVLAFSTSAASFTRGPENDTITAEDVESFEIIAGATTKGKPEYVINGDGLAAWGGNTGTQLKITFVNEWEITSAKAHIISNWAHMEFIFYAADGTKLGSYNGYGLSSNSGFVYGSIDHDMMNDTPTNITAGVNGISYGDSDKAIKYVVLNNYGAKASWVPGIAELILTGRERVPSVGCENHEWDTMYDPEPTCTESGLEIRYCTLCGAAEDPITAPALGHKIGDYQITKDPTCTHGAEITFVCANGCGETIVRDMFVQDVTDFGDWYSIATDGAGGDTSSGQALFDNNMGSYLHASGGWFVESSMTLDTQYYISSVTVWTGSYHDLASWEARIIFYYKAAAADSEWIQVGIKQAAVEKAGEKYKHTLELDTPVKAGAIKIRVDKLNSYGGQAFEAEVAGSILPDTVANNHDWVAGETVAPQCSALGYTSYTCSTCGETKKDSFVKYTDKHEYTVELEETKIDATCTAEGSVKMQCITCTKTQDKKIPAKGHTEGSATCTADYACENCGEILIPATGHTWEGTDCVNCDAVRVATIGEVSYLTFEEALAAAVEGDTIVVLDKVTVEGDVTWDLTGKTIQFPNVVDNYAVVVKGNLTIVGGTFTFAGEYGIGVQKTASLTINDGTFTTVGTYYLIGSWGTTVINGGSYEAYYNVVNCFAGTLSVTGGTFVAIDDGSGYGPDAVLGEDEGVATITGGTFNTDVTAYLAPEYIQVDGAVIACPHNEYTEATCTDDSVCKACGKLGEEKLGHVESTVEGRAPTCTEDGLTDGVVCEECGEVLEAQKPIPAAHTWSEELAVITEPTCITEGVGKYYCTVCWETLLEMVYDEVRGEIAIPVNPSAHADMEFTNEKYNFAVCPDCEGYKFYGMHGGIGNTWTFFFMGDYINIYGDDFDEYYYGANYSVVDGVYTFELIESDYANTTYVGAQVTITFNNNDSLYIALTSGEDTYYFGEENADVEQPDYNYLLNGTYAFYDMGGVVQFIVKFEDGTIYVIQDNMMLGLSESFSYTYNPTTGTITTDEGYFYVTNDELYFGRGWLLTPYTEEPAEPELPEGIGEQIGSMDVETTDTYGPYDLYSYTANKAGKYTFFFPAGLGAVDKAAVQSFGVMPIFELDYFSNATGEFVSINLEAGETLEFFIIATTKDTWTIDVYYYAEEQHVCNYEIVAKQDATCTTAGYIAYACVCGAEYVDSIDKLPHTDVEIPAVRPTPSTVGYTAGTECEVCGTVTKAPVEINITKMDNDKSVNTVFRVAALNLSAQENLSVNYKLLVTEGYNNPYIVFVFDGKEYIVDEYSIEASSGRYVFNFAETRPQLMASNISAYIYAETAEGEYTEVNYATYSVLQYILGQLKKNDPALTTVMSDILVMGAKTQLYMGVNTNALVTDLATAEGYTLTPTAFTTIDADNQQAVTGDRTTGTDWKAISLAFGASTEIVFKFETDNLEGLKVKVTVAGRETYYDAKDLPMDGNRYVVYFPGVRSYEYEEKVVATFERDGVQVGSTFEYSVNTFLLKNYENTGKYDSNAIDLMKAIYIYGESIAKYFA